MTFNPVAVAPEPAKPGSKNAKNIDQAADALKAKLGSGVVVSVEKAHKGDPFLVVNAKDIKAVLGFLRDDAEFACTLLQVIAAVDYLPVAAVPAVAATEGQAAVEGVKAKPGTMAVFYSVFSFAHKHQINVKVFLDRDNPQVDSVTELFRAANWYERECFDLLGVVFKGHPDLSRILLPPDWVGHPLRRDYVFPEEYNGMKVAL